MKYSNSYKSKQFFALVVKLFIVIGCGYFIYDKIFTNEQQSISDFYSILAKNNVFLTKNALFLLILTIFNWFLEILKWQTLVSFYKKISLKSASIQSLSSLTTSLITPNRIGEYGAKAVYYKKPLRKKIMALNLVGNLSQLAVTIIFGIIGCIYLAFNFHIKFNYISALLLFFLIISLLFTIWFIDNRGFTKNGYTIQSLIKYLKTFPKNSVHKVFQLSVFRFLIFSHQFYYLILIFNIDITYTDAIMSVFSMYVIASIIPMLSLFDVVIKSSVAMVVFALFQVDESIILAIVLLMWIFNFVLPSIVGAYFVLTFNTDKLILQKDDSH